LPITFPKSLDQLPAYEDYSMAGRTYRYMTEEPLYPFGFGLSYASFTYGDISLDHDTVDSGATVNASVRVTNTSNTAADEVVQLYITDLEASVDVPLHSLRSIQRLHLEPGESSTLSFQITPEDMEIVDDAGERVLEPGDFAVTIGGSSPGSRSAALGAAKPTRAVVTVN
jgi:beta-glucosidase